MNPILKELKKILELILIVGTIILIICSSYVFYKRNLKQTLNSQIDLTFKDLDLINDQDVLSGTIDSNTEKSPECTELESKFPNLVDSDKKMIPIFFYHHVGYKFIQDKQKELLVIPTEEFEKQLKYLSDNGFTTIDTATWIALYNCGHKAPERTVILSFDDGLADFYTDVFPLLKKYNFSAEIFIPTGLVGYNENYLTWDMLKEINDSGLVTISSHTVWHIHMRDVSDGDLVKEITQSQKDLEDHLGYKPKGFAYPFGEYSDKVIDELKKLYDYGLTIDYKRAEWDGNMYKIPRYQVYKYTTMNIFTKNLYQL